jgi:pimeloyl-ACP methyl ester carboxylesterase
MDVVEFPYELLPLGIRSRFVANVNGLRMHILEAGYETDDRPVVLLLHGFPELAWCWRMVIPALAAAGFHVVAPDQRGYGRTTGWDAAYDGDLASFRPLNLVQDLLDLVFALGHRHVRAIVGHDFGSPIAAHCALIRPDIFTSLVMMSAPFGGAPPAGAAPGQQADIPAALASLTPALTYRPACSSALTEPAPTCAAGTWSLAPGTGCSKSRPRRLPSFSGTSSRS